MTTDATGPSATSPSAHQGNGRHHDRIPLPPHETPLTDALQQRLHTVRQLVSELTDYAKHYLTARLDRLAFSVRRVMFLAVLGMGAAIVGLAALIYATILLMSGVAEALGLIFGNRPWLGSIVTGLLVLGVSGIVTYYVVSSIAGKSRKQVHDRYEALKAQQRQQHGHDVDTLAGKSASARGDAIPAN